MLRQLISLGHLRTEGEFNTLELSASARDVLRGEVQLHLRTASEVPRRGSNKTARSGKAPRGKAPPLALDDAGLARFDALKAWRAEVAREHNLPAYVVFHDAHLAEMARQCPGSLEALSGISGVGAKKLEAYGAAILRVLAQTD